MLFGDESWGSVPGLTSLFFHSLLQDIVNIAQRNLRWGELPAHIKHISVNCGWEEMDGCGTGTI